MVSSSQGTPPAAPVLLSPHSYRGFEPGRLPRRLTFVRSPVACLKRRHRRETPPGWKIQFSHPSSAGRVTRSHGAAESGACDYGFSCRRRTGRARRVLRRVDLFGRIRSPCGRGGPERTRARAKRRSLIGNPPSLPRAAPRFCCGSKRAASRGGTMNSFWIAWTTEPPANVPLQHEPHPLPV